LGSFWPSRFGPVRAGSGRFPALRAPNMALVGPWVGSFRPFSGLVWVLFSPVFGPVLGSSGPLFRAGGPETPFSGFTARSRWAPFSALFSGGFGSFSALLACPGPPGQIWLSQGLGLGLFPCFRPFWPVCGSFPAFSGLSALRAEFLPTGYRVAAPLFPGFPAFRPFWASFGGPRALRPLFGLYSKVFLALPARILAFSQASGLGPQKAPSRGMLWALRAPNVPLWPPCWGAPLGRPRTRRPVAYLPPAGPQMYHFSAPFGPLSGPSGQIRRHSTGFFAEGEKACRMPPDLGLRPKRADTAPRTLKRGQKGPFCTSVWGLGAAGAPKPD